MQFQSTAIYRVQSDESQVSTFFVYISLISVLSTRGARSKTKIFSFTDYFEYNKMASSKHQNIDNDNDLGDSAGEPGPGPFNLGSLYDEVRAL